MIAYCKLKECLHLCSSIDITLLSLLSLCFEIPDMNRLNLPKSDTVGDNSGTKEAGRPITPTETPRSRLVHQLMLLVPLLPPRKRAWYWAIGPEVSLVRLRTKTTGWSLVI